MKTIKLPNFFIIGAPKAGTTSLSHYLSKHPQVFFSVPKEPHYFNDDFSFRHTNDFDTYCQYFNDVKNHHKAIGEGSVFYLFSKTAVTNILKLKPDAKFIVMVRDPVEISYSWHAQAVHSFGENVFDFETAWDLQSERKTGENIPLVNNVREALFYSDLAKLGEQIQHVRDQVSREQIHYIIFDEFKKDPEKEYIKVLEFLDLDVVLPDSFQRLNASKAYKSPALKRVENYIYWFKRRIGTDKRFGLSKIFNLSGWNTKSRSRAPLNPEFKLHLKEHFAEDVRLLSNIIGQDLMTLWNYELKDLEK